MKITLTGSEKAISVLGAYASVKNNTSVTVYASNKQGIDISSENVTPIQPNESAVIPDCNKTVYVMGTGEIAVESSNQPFNFFKPAPVSGGGGTGDGITLEQLNAALVPYETIANADRKLEGKVNIVEGYGLSQEDYTADEKKKLAGLKNYTEATTSKAGLMSAEDKSYLNNLQNYGNVVFSAKNTGSSGANNICKVMSVQFTDNVGINNCHFAFYTESRSTHEHISGTRGILHFSIKGNSGGAIIETETGLEWEFLNEKGNPEQFILAYNTEKHIFDVFVITYKWSIIQGALLLQDASVPGVIKAIEYYNTVDENVEIPTDYTQKPSVLGRLKGVTYDLATKSVSGLMSAADKAKLDSLWVDGAKSILPTGTDFNTITETGLYKCKSNGEYPNRPENLNTGGILQVLQYDNTNIEQIYHRFNDNVVWIRNQYREGWSEWVALVTSDSEATPSSAGLMSAADKSKLDNLYPAEHADILNDMSQLSHSGFFNFGSVDENFVNGNVISEDFKFTEWQAGDYDCILISDAFNEAGCIYGNLIVASPRLPSYFWYGQIWEGHFERWQKIYSPDKLPVATVSAAGLMSAEDKFNLNSLWVDTTKTNLPNGTDLNMITETGLYKLVNNGEYTNTPFSTTRGGILQVFQFDRNYSEQMFYKIGENIIYHRNKNYDLGWNEWAILMTSNGGTFTGSITAPTGNFTNLNVTNPPWTTDAQTLNGQTAQQIWGYHSGEELSAEQTTALLQDCTHNNHIKHVKSLQGFLSEGRAESVISFGCNGFVFQIMYSPMSYKIAYRQFWSMGLLSDTEGWHILGNTATATAAGLMSAADKAKLDSFETRIAALEGKA